VLLLLHVPPFHVPGGDLESAVESSLRAVNLWNNKVGDKQARQYSGGMKRRLSVAISFTGNPLVVYLDEPSTVSEPSKLSAAELCLSGSTCGQLDKRSNPEPAHCSVMRLEVEVSSSGSLSAVLRIEGCVPAIFARPSYQHQAKPCFVLLGCKLLHCHNMHIWMLGL
jgi:hypothetical protein